MVCKAFIHRFDSGPRLQQFSLIVHRLQRVFVLPSIANITGSAGTHGKGTRVCLGEYLWQDEAWRSEPRPLLTTPIVYLSAYADEHLFYEAQIFVAARSLQPAGTLGMNLKTEA